jgi:two-component system, OmpR family, sensor histidine kinase KdpD
MSAKSQRKREELNSGRQNPAKRSLIQTNHALRLALRYLAGLALVLGATGISALVHPYITPTNLVVLYLLTVVIAALYLGRGPAIMTSILGVAAFDYFFVPPHLTLVVSNSEYLITFAGLLGVGLVISQLTTIVKNQAEAVHRREAEAIELYELSRDLAAAGDIESIARVAVSRVGQTFGREAAIFLPVQGKLTGASVSPGMELSKMDTDLAAWTYGQGQAAGRGTEFHPEEKVRHQPLKTLSGMVGVLSIQFPDKGKFLSQPQLRILNAFANQIAMAVERARFSEQAHQKELLEITDKLQNALLNSISHDLRTPLVSIKGALSSLTDAQLTLDENAKQSLLETASEEADRLNRLVENLLDMTRLESGVLRIKQDACDIQDLIGSSLEETDSRLKDHPVETRIPDDLPLVKMDFVLMERVLVNVIDNAVKYSPLKAPIQISALKTGGFVEITVSDKGSGIPPEDIKKIFNKFFRVQRPDSVTGTGLGLAIGKGIVEAHGGFITAENRPGGGTTITIALPVESQRMEK